MRSVRWKRGDRAKASLVYLQTSEPVILHNRISGETFDLDRTPEDRALSRIKRMRKAVWCGTMGLRDLTDTQGGSLCMFTLTYKGVKDWRPRDMSDFVRWLRRKDVVHYLWVAELQERGAVHYHVLAILPPGQKWVKPSPENGGWHKGFTWVTPDIKYPWYVLKYIQKGTKNGEWRRWPKGVRLYAVSQSVVRSFQFSVAVDYHDLHLPTWYREGAEDASIRLSSSRTLGGVANGRYLACTPYTKRDLAPIADIASVMYTNAWGGGLLPQS